MARRLSTGVGCHNRRPVAVASLFVTLGIVFSACGPAPAVGLPTLSSPVQLPPGIHDGSAVQGQIDSPGGPNLYDRQGRVVLFHGVDAVYKRPPYELYPDPGKPWNFSEEDASLIASLGFNVVRLGMTWKGLEPGTAPADDPSICAPGAPHDPRQFDKATIDAYLSKLAKTVDLLGRFHIYTILDMHQDVYNELFDGEGAPDWAVCTGDIPVVHPPGRWSRNYGTAAAEAAYSNFWTNDVVGDLQGEYDRVWSAVATYFRSSPWVLGYDPMNEPFAKSPVELECFYAGTRYAGSSNCPAQDPAVGVIPDILAPNPRRLIFYESDIYSIASQPNALASLSFPNLVDNVHVYCRYRSPVTGNPTDVSACDAQEESSLASRVAGRNQLSTSYQPKGPSLFVTEFGATSDAAVLEPFIADADQTGISWIYWQWKYYDDPTGSSDEGLVSPDGDLRSTVHVLSETYAQAIAGAPISMSFDPSNGTFVLRYTPKHSIHAPSVIFVPTEVHDQKGYCARVTGGVVISQAGSDILDVRNASTGHLVTVKVSPGSC